MLIVVFNNDGDVIALVLPVDQFNPQFTIDEIEKLGDFRCETVQATTFSDFKEYSDGV
jgi:hypothetical protein